MGCDPSARLHISDTLGACSRSHYALRVLRVHGLPPAALQEVTRATDVKKRFLRLYYFYKKTRFSTFFYFLNVFYFLVAIFYPTKPPKLLHKMAFK